MEELVRQALTIVRGMWRLRWPGVVAAWLVAVVGVVVVMRIPDQFEGSARIYVDTQSILKPLMSGLTVQPNVEQQINMLSRTLLSRPNLEKLVRMADLDLKAASKAEQETLIDDLSKKIQIRNTGRDNLYWLEYRDADREKAKRLVQSLVSVFVESSLGASRKDTDSAKSFLNEQIKQYEAKLEEAETRLKEFRLRNLDMQSADGKDTASRMGETLAQLEAARLQLREAEKSRDSAKRQLAEARGQSPSTALPNLLGGGPVGAASVSTPELDSRIDAQKRNLDGLLQRYTEQHPEVVGVKRLIADLEEQRRKEVLELQRRAALQPTGGRSEATESLAVQELTRMLATAEVQTAALRARVDEYAGRYAQVKNSLKLAPQIEAEAAQLNRDYAINKKNYDDLVSRRQSAVMSGELEVASGVADFRLIDPPRVTPQPVAPNRLLLLPIALVAALAAGMAVSFGASQMWPVYSDGNELRTSTGLPLLGVVSLVMSEADRQRERAGTLLFFGASGGLVGLFVLGMVTMVILARRAI